MALHWPINDFKIITIINICRKRYMYLKKKQKTGFKLRGSKRLLEQTCVVNNGSNLVFMFCIVWQNKFSILFLKSYKFFKIWIVEHYLRYIPNLLKILPQLVPFLLLLKKKFNFRTNEKWSSHKNGKWIRDIKFFVSSKMYNIQQSNSRSQPFMLPIPYWTKGVSF